MHAYSKTRDLDDPKVTAEAVNLDELQYDEAFCDELIDAINENFVLEVEASIAMKMPDLG